MAKWRSIICTVGINAFVLLCNSTSCFAQTSASASVAATIVTPATFEKLADLEISIPTSSSRINGPAKTTKPGRDRIASPKSTLAPASFLISGYASYTYGITMPTRITATKNGQLISIVPALTSATSSHTLSNKGAGAVSITASSVTISSTSGKRARNSEDFAVTVVYN